VNAYVTGAASFLPNDPVSGDQIEAVLGKAGGQPSRTRARVLKANGILNRYYAVNPATGKATHTNAQLTAEAVRLLASKSSLDLTREISLLACGTASPDQFMPSHGSMVHGELASPPCEVFTTSGACCVSMAALKYAALAVGSGDAKNAIVTGSELMSPLMRGSHFEPELEERVRALEENPTIAFEHDFLRWMLSDGAGAVLVEPEPRAKGDMPSARIEWIEFLSYAGQMEASMYHGARKRGSSLEGWKSVEDPRERIRNGFFNVGQDARLMSEHIGRLCGTEALTAVLKKHPMRADDIAWFLPHYSSAFFRGEVTKRLEEAGLPIPSERHFSNLADKGNVGSASVFLLIDELFHSGRARPGQKILCFVPESARFSVAYMLLTVV
jgi:3-oxoacyl-[acyl-carrier-protein] synthase III